MPDSRTIHRYRIIARPTARLLIPAFGGSMIRGAVGHALLREHCHCRSDIHQTDCLYASLFEGGAKHAFVITPPAEGVVEAEETFECFVTLLKTDERHTHALFDALESGFAHGLGAGSIPCELLAFEPQPLDITPLGKSVRLQLTSPWFVKYKGKMLKARELTIHNLLVTMAQRQRTLIREGAIDGSVPDNSQLLALADTLHAKMHVRDVRSQRRSTRQNKKHPISGISGSVDIHAPSTRGLRDLTPLLYRAQWLHNGGKISFGLGGLAIEPIPHIHSQLGDLARMARGEAL